MTGFVVPAFTQEKEEVHPFLFGAIQAKPEIVPQLEAINNKFDEVFNKHDATAVAAFYTANAYKPQIGDTKIPLLRRQQQSADKPEKPTMPSPTRDQVFISYSHENTKWREDLEKHLKPYLRAGSIKSWSDKQISPGSQWFTEIKTALSNTKVAVLLVTSDFIASDFIHQYELGPFLKEAKQGGVGILWVPVSASSYKKTALKDYQAVLDPAQPLANMTDAERDQAWVKICEEIEKAVNP